MDPSGAALTAAVGTATLPGGEQVPAWLYNGAFPGPTIRRRSGDRVQARLFNQLAEPTIIHWHGLIVPPEADGHPRDAIGPGATYDYDFPVLQRAGTFWYHPHPHGLTAGQVHRGMAGLLIVTDAEEESLGLPTGNRELLVILQDRDEDTGQAMTYAPTADDLHAGMLRATPFGNGARRPAVHVTGARYRLRILNASNARVYLLARSDGAPLDVIGNDGGLLPAVTSVDSVYLGIGERVDWLLDAREIPVGGSLMLRSLPFMVPDAPGNPPQGAPMDLLELIRDPGSDPAAGPPLAHLSAISPLGAPVAEREFVFRSSGGDQGHTINGLTYDMNRVDERIPLAAVERWTFRNDSGLPHPVHLHGTHFQVESRSGGRGVVYPYEAGWKDTVLVMPLESVAVRVCFDRYRGIFPLHCHNMQHEDLGMMLNIEVI